MTSPEVARALKNGYHTAILMTASIEQNGPHLTLDKHVLTGQATAVGVARKLGKTLVAPLLPFGRADEHTAFAGTFSYSAELFARSVTELVENLVRMGFHRVVLMGDHGSNQPPLTALAAELDMRFAPRAVRVVFVGECYTRADAKLEPELVSAGVVKPGLEHSAHAGLIDTAMLMALDATRVRALPAAPGPLRLTADEQRLVGTAEGLKSVSASGMLGDPRGATPAIGRRALTLLVNECAAEAEATLQRTSTAR